MLNVDIRFSCSEMKAQLSDHSRLTLQMSVHLLQSCVYIHTLVFMATLCAVLFVITHNIVFLCKQMFEDFSVLAVPTFSSKLHSINIDINLLDDSV